VVGHQQVVPVTALGQGRTDPEALVAPCTLHGLSPAELLDPADGPVSALRVQALAPGPALVPLALGPVAQVV
jgi:hypothetical protein